jgi:hypothetical protein
MLNDVIVNVLNCAISTRNKNDLLSEVVLILSVRKPARADSRRFGTPAMQFTLHV